jgi:hypothetical protein
MVNVKPTIDGSAVREAIRELKKIDPKLVKALRKDLRNSLQSLASGIAGSWPADAPLSGMKHTGRTAYQPVTASASFTPGIARRGKASSLFGVRVRIPDNRVGAWLAEMGGMRGEAYISGYTRVYTKNSKPARHKMSGQGAYMIDRINRRTPMKGRGGRYGWAYFVGQKKDVRDKGIRILEKAVEAINRSSE